MTPTLPAHAAHMTPLQLKAYRAPWSNDGPCRPPLDVLPSGEVIGLSLNK
jgi:hypothetical protein